MKLTVVVEAGGQSQRMKQDKALLSFLGEPLVARVVTRVTLVADEVIVVTNRPHDYAFLQVPLVEDLYPGKGPLGGLYTAMIAANYPLVAVVACDMPFVSVELLKAEVRILDEGGFDAVLPATEQGLEPFHAIYRRDGCVPAIQRALENDQLRMVSWLSDVRAYTMKPSEVSRYDPQQSVFFNANTPDDFQKAETIAKTLFQEKAGGK